MSDEGCVDLMYLACNRLEFTRETFTALLKNTDWHHVHELFVYDDGSQDGTREWLESAISQAPVRARFVKTNFGSPVAAMVHFIETARAPILAKTDNDAMLPPAWLRLSLEVLERHPELTLLGIEAMYPHEDDVHLARSYTPAQFISGLGLYRRKAFLQSRPVPYQKWFGLEEWQMVQGAGLVRGWITPAIPVFLLDRIPFEPWKSYTDTYVRRGWQRSWPKYDSTCTLWLWRWPGSRLSRASVLGGDARFLCAMRIKNEAEHIHEVLSSVMPLCGRTFVFDDHSRDKTVEICRSFGERLKIWESPFRGLNEARDKNFLLKEIIRANPEWVLWIDGDEVLEKTGPDNLKLAAENGRTVAAYYIRIAYLWHDPQHVRVDGIFGKFKRLSFFRLKDQPVRRLHFPSSGRGGNFHCGNVPAGLVGEYRELPVRMKHYGYMTKEQRQAKYSWYSRIDPNNQCEDNYRHLAEIRGARFAPGPLRIIPWTE
jgi:glycosyltransferase involved in cell wall biosynthesis